MKYVRAWAVAAVLCSAFVTTAQARMKSVPLLAPDRVVMKSMTDQGVTAAQVRKAILMGSQPYGWVVEQDNPGVIHLSYNKQDKHKAVVRVDYDAAGYQLSYESSTNLYQEVGEDGVNLIHPTYNMWVRNLLARIMVPGETVPASTVKSEAIN